jgi:hypothetical protein
MDKGNRMRLVILSLAAGLLTACPAAAGQLFSERNDVTVMESVMLPCKVHGREGLER